MICLRWIAVITPLVALGGFIHMRRLLDEQLEAGTESIGVAAVDDFDPGEAEDWKGALPIEVARAFLHAKSNDERLQVVRSPELVDGILRQFFNEGPGARERIIDLRPLPTMRSAKLSLVRYEVIMDQRPSRTLNIEVTENGAKADFESYARHGSASWEKLLDGSEAEARVRVLAKGGGYYNFAFADDTRWLYVGATSPDLDRSLDLYVERGSQAAKDMIRIAGKHPMRVTISIRSVENSHMHRQFEITRVHAAGWVLE